MIKEENSIKEEDSIKEEHLSLKENEICEESKIEEEKTLSNIKFDGEKLTEAEKVIRNIIEVKIEVALLKRKQILIMDEINKHLNDLAKEPAKKLKALEDKIKDKNADKMVVVADNLLIPSNDNFQIPS
jgi:hypothetical protein